MENAIENAKKALSLGEVPVGAVIVKDEKVIAQGFNTRERDGDATAHAEIVAIKAACESLGWRLNGCRLYVTLEPCPMCAGAIINARIGEVIFGAYDPKAGACGSVVNLFNLFGVKTEIFGGIKEHECRRLLEGFFKGRRHGQAIY